MNKTDALNKLFNIDECVSYTMSLEFNKNNKMVDPIKSFNSYSFYKPRHAKKIFKSYKYCFINKDNIQSEEDLKIALNKYNKEVIKKRFFTDDFTKDVEKKFNSVVNGKGSEWKSIRTLHSSSLCGFLHFCKVGEKEIVVPGNWFNVQPKRDLVFDIIQFEYEANCLGSNSSIDVLLKSSKNSHLYLFVELKFSEYFNLADYDFASKYFEIYKRIFPIISASELKKDFPTTNLSSNLALSVAKYKDTETNRKNGKVGELKKDDQNHLMLTLSSIDKDNSFYLEGIKQLISHSIAISNLDLGKDAEIYYLELAFNLENTELKSKNDSTNLGKFNKNFNEIVQILSKNKCFNNINYCNRIYSYKELFENTKNIELLNEKIRNFYKYN